MIPTVDSETLSWLRSETWIFAAAAGGGIVVLIGLWMEYVSVDEKRYESVDIAGFRRLKSRERQGEIWVIVGIIIEIAVAVVFAGREDWHSRKMEIAIKKADLRNQPINKVEAYAMILTRFPNRPNPVENFSNLMKNAGGLNVRLHDNGSDLDGWLDFGVWPPLLTSIPSENVTASIDVLGTNSFLRFDMFFSGDILPNSYRTNSGILTANSLNAVKLIMPSWCEVVQGKLELKINSSLEKHFDIPAQTSFAEAITSIATNGGFKPFTDEQYRMK